MLDQKQREASRENRPMQAELGETSHIVKN